MFHDYKEEKIEFKKEYLDKELKGQLCRVIGVYEKTRNGQPITLFNGPAASICFRVEDGLESKKIHYEKMTTEKNTQIMKGEAKIIAPWQLKKLIVACGFSKLDENGEIKVEPNPFNLQELVNSEIYIDFENRDNKGKKYLHIKKVYSVDEFNVKQISFESRIEME